jgi:sterol desaturase/sphingolipid hydroxylase (fatty acid hydroxylase superfamily)
LGRSGRRRLGDREAVRVRVADRAQIEPGVTVRREGAKMADIARIGRREARGGFEPPEPIHPPPVFLWPPQPVPFLKWFFGYPGYLWPWNSLYAVTAVLTWVWLTPDLARMKTFELGWVATILVRNFGLIVIVAGAWHLRLYVQQAQGTKFKYNSRWLATNNPTFLFRSQLLDNIFWTVISAVPIWSGYEVLTLWGQANGYLPTVDWQAHPVYCVLLMLFIPLFREVHFYLVHRLIHWPPLYRTVHHLHHQNVNPGPWSGLAMHPVEHLLYFSGVLLHWIVPSHPIHVIYHLQHLAFAPSQGHSGFDQVVVNGKITLNNDHYMHYLHHKYFEVNYGGDGVVPIDKWFGTYHDGSPEAEAAMNRRVLGRKQSS